MKKQNNTYLSTVFQFIEANRITEESSFKYSDVIDNKNAPDEQV